MSDDAIKRAKEIVRANEWEGDMRANMTLIIGAGRVLAKRLDELDAAAKSVITWVPVSERLPDNDRVVLVSLESNGPLVWFGYLEDEAWRLAAGDKVAVRVDHWAELPTPPASEEREGCPREDQRGYSKELASKRKREGMKIT